LVALRIFVHRRILTPAAFMSWMGQGALSQKAATERAFSGSIGETR
jgi:hypothetical protein